MAKPKPAWTRCGRSSASPAERGSARSASTAPAAMDRLSLKSGAERHLPDSVFGNGITGLVGRPGMGDNSRDRRHILWSSNSQKIKTLRGVRRMTYNPPPKVGILRTTDNSARLTPLGSDAIREEGHSGCWRRIRASRLELPDASEPVLRAGWHPRWPKQEK